MPDEMAGQTSKPQNAVTSTPQARGASNPPRLSNRCRPRAFTLIEVMVVIGIIGLLVAIAIPAASRMIDSTKISATKSTMETLENAIAEFTRQHPLPKSAYYGALPPDGYAFYAETFDLASNDANDNGRWDPGEIYTPEDQGATLPPGYVEDGRFNPNSITGFRGDIAGVSPGDTSGSGSGFWRRITGSVSIPDEDPEPLANNPYPLADYNKRSYDADHRSIEALYLYISQLCPRGKAILDKLPVGSIVANRDQCGGSDCPDGLIIGTRKDTGLFDPKGRIIDLYEVYDAWGRALRYAVRATVSDGYRYTWELRSAGPDGKFEEMFDRSQNGDGDDVIRQGQ